MAFSNQSTLESTNMYATAKNNSRRYNSPRRHTGHKGAAKTPFCKVCYDAGRPKEEYQSHYVKDRPGPHGKVVCPLLLNQECSYCHKKGHTPKQCPEIAAKNARIAERKRQLELQARAPDMDGFCCVKAHTSRRGCGRSTFKSQKETFAPAKKQGAFDALISDSDEEVEEEKVQEDFPAIGNAPTKVAPVTSGWAAVAAAAPKPAPIKVTAPESLAPPKIVRQDNSAWSDEEDATEDFWAKQQANSAKYAGKSWADSDWDDSSDEDDDEW